jgi:hypothetical protein
VVAGFALHRFCARRNARAEIHLTDETEKDPRVENTDYPQAGDPNPLVTLGVADVTKTSLIPNVTRLPRVGNRVPPGLARFGDLVKFVDTSKYKPEDFSSRASPGRQIRAPSCFRRRTASRLSSTSTSVFRTTGG